MKYKSLVSAITCIFITIAMTFGMTFLSADAAMAANINNGQTCFGQVSDAKGGNYVGQWIIGNFSGEGQPLTKVCERKQVLGENSAPVSEGNPCYVKWNTGESFIGSIFFDGTYKKYGCKSYS